MIEFLDQDFSGLNEWIDENPPSQIFFLADENTHQYCLPILLGNLQSSVPFEIIELEPGEELKNLESTHLLWTILSEFKADRKSLLINVGGGVLTDLGGFVASTYKRGIPFLHVPTTLLSMCDASLGGKTGIDLGHLKNIVGTFSFPQRIFVYPDFLKTLPKEEFDSGFAEMLKHGLILDASHYQKLSLIQDPQNELTQDLIEDSMKIKSEVVEKDFKEKNVRKLLNFGHTVGHAIESHFLQAQQSVSHGHCVAIGMWIESELSFQKELLTKEECEEIQRVISNFYPYLELNVFPTESLLEVMRNDKKNESQQILFTLLRSIGSGIFDQKVEENEIISALEQYKSCSWR